MKRLAIVTTHPIQYYAPVFRLLSQKMDGHIRVFYTAGKEAVSFDSGFQKSIEWDIPLLTGYAHSFLKNTASNPSLGNFKGIINPDAIQEITAYDPHAVLVYGWSYHSHLSIMRHFSGKIPVWFRGDSTLLDETDPLRKFFRKIWLRRVYGNVDVAFYTGSANKDYYKKAGLQENQLRFAPHAVENERFSQTLCTEVKELRAQFDIPENAIVILFAGKFEHKKDPLLLLNAFSQLNDSSAYLLFTGNGILESQLKQIASGMKQKQQIRFAGFQNQSAMPAVYQLCDLFCLPSRGPGETWGLAVNEAMAAGKAVLVSDKTGCAMDLVREKINGTVFGAGNEKQLAEKLGYMISDKARLKEMGAESKRIISDWSFQKQTDAFINALNTL